MPKETWDRLRNRLVPIGVYGFTCIECGKTLEPEDLILTCSDCGAIFCKECIENGCRDYHECEEEDL